MEDTIVISDGSVEQNHRTGNMRLLQQKKFHPGLGWLW
jgi:hypothetical protein